MASDFNLKKNVVAIEKTLQQFKFKLENGIQKQEKLENNKDEIFILLHYAAMITLFLLFINFYGHNHLKDQTEVEFFREFQKNSHAIWFL